MTKFTESFIKTCRMQIELGYDLGKDFPAALDEIERLRAAKQEVEGFLRESEKEVLRLKAVIYKEVGDLKREEDKEVEKMMTCRHGLDPYACGVCRNLY